MKRKEILISLALISMMSEGGYHYNNSSETNLTKEDLEQKRKNALVERNLKLGIKDIYIVWLLVKLFQSVRFRKNQVKQ